ncbi:MAG: ubiquinol-cytochrome C chaperone family protein [Alsobacter sp.]
MVFGLFGRRNRNAEIVERLYVAVADAARRPGFFAELGAPDTVEGRFEMVTLHAHLAVRRLRALPAPGPDLGQDLVDAVFAHFDAALRELGVGDISVPKKMKTMASAFLGRAKAYEEALTQPAQRRGDALRAALLRNVWNNQPGREAAARRLSAWVEEAVAALEKAGFDDFVAGRVAFPPLAGAERPAEHSA